MRSWVLLPACCLLGACSLFVSTDDLHSSTATDAGGEPRDAGSADAPPASNDGSNGMPDAEASIPFCARRNSTFCADFGGGTPDEGWSRADIDRGSLDLAVEGSSAPALRVSLLQGKGLKAARLHRDFATTPADVHVELDVAIADALSNVRELLKLEVPTSHETVAAGYFSSGLLLQLSGDELRVVVEWFDAMGDPLEATYVSGKPFPVGAWAHVELDAVLSPSNGSLEVKIDGTSAISRTGITTLTDEPQGSRLIVGAFAFDLEPASVYLIDNVLLDAK